MKRSSGNGSSAEDGTWRIGRLGDGGPEESESDSCKVSSTAPLSVESEGRKRFETDNGAVDCFSMIAEAECRL